MELKIFVFNILLRFYFQRASAESFCTPFILKKCIMASSKRWMPNSTNLISWGK